MAQNQLTVMLALAKTKVPAAECRFSCDQKTQGEMLIGPVDVGVAVKKAEIKPVGNNT